MLIEIGTQICYARNQEKLGTRGGVTMSVLDGFDLEKCTWTDNHGLRWVHEGLRWGDFLRAIFLLRHEHPTAREYVEAYTSEFPWGQFCLKYGQVSVREGYRTIRDRIDCRGFMEEGACYRNAMSILRSWRTRRPSWISGKQVSYVEGLALDRTGIFLHAWIDIDGVAYDITFQRAFMTTYFGVRLDPEKADATMRRIGYYGLLHWWSLSEPFVYDALVTQHVS